MTVGLEQAGYTAVVPDRVPELSIVIVTYNSRSDLETCLASLYTQQGSAEIIVVDNCSTDDVVLWVRRRHPLIRLLPLGANCGYSAACNKGIRMARGRYVLVLNPDTVAQPGALEELLCVAERFPRSFVNPILLQPDGSLNTCGNVMHYTGVTTCAGLGEDPMTCSGIQFPCALSGAAILARREAWLEIGGFDDQFFLYLEDTDLSLRARLRGYTLVCAADARVTHRYDLNMRPDKLYYLERNRLLMLLKTYEGKTLRQVLPALLLTELLTWTYAAIKGPGYIVARWRGYIWLWQHRTSWLSARSTVQATRQLPDAELLGHASVALPFRQVVTWRRLADALEAATTPLYRRTRPLPQYTADDVMDRRKHTRHASRAVTRRA